MSNIVTANLSFLNDKTGTRISYENNSFNFYASNNLIFNTNGSISTGNLNFSNNYGINSSNISGGNPSNTIYYDNIKKIQLSNGSLTSNLNIGSLEYKDRNLLFTNDSNYRGLIQNQQYIVLNNIRTSNSNFLDSNTADPIFGKKVTLSSNTVYIFEGSYLLQKNTASTNQHSIYLTFGSDGRNATANINYINWLYQATRNIIVNPTVNNYSETGFSNNESYYCNTHTMRSPMFYYDANNSVSNTSTILQWSNATINYVIAVSGVLSISNGGTFSPAMFIPNTTTDNIYGVNNPFLPLNVMPGSYFSLYPVGIANTSITIGNWV